MESATTPTFRRGGASYGGTELPAHQPLPQFLMLGSYFTIYLVERDTAKAEGFRR